jgi:hypothetical protein
MVTDSIFNPISKYTDSKYALGKIKDTKSKHLYVLEYPYESGDIIEREEAIFRNKKTALKAQSIGENYFQNSAMGNTNYKITKYKNRQFRKPSLIKRSKSISKSIAKRPKSMIKKATRKMRRK